MADLPQTIPLSILFINIIIVVKYTQHSIISLYISRICQSKSSENIEQQNVSPRKIPDQNQEPGIQIEEHGRLLRRSPRKVDLSEEQKKQSRMSVLLVSYNLLILKLFFTINKEMNHIFMPFYIFPTVKLKRQVPGNVSQKQMMMTLVGK